MKVGKQAIMPLPSHLSDHFTNPDILSLIIRQLPHFNIIRSMTISPLFFDIASPLIYRSITLTPERITKHILPRLREANASTSTPSPSDIRRYNESYGLRRLMKLVRHIRLVGDCKLSTEDWELIASTLPRLETLIIVIDENINVPREEEAISEHLRNALGARHVIFQINEIQATIADPIPLIRTRTAPSTTSDKTLNTITSPPEAVTVQVSPRLAENDPGNWFVQEDFPKSWEKTRLVVVLGGYSRSQAENKEGEKVDANRLVGSKVGEHKAVRRLARELARIPKYLKPESTTFYCLTDILLAGPTDESDDEDYEETTDTSRSPTTEKPKGVSGEISLGNLLRDELKRNGTKSPVELRSRKDYLEDVDSHNPSIVGSSDLSRQHAENRDSQLAAVLGQGDLGMFFGEWDLTPVGTKCEEDIEMREVDEAE